jgi:hypothetical protein
MIVSRDHDLLQILKIPLTSMLLDKSKGEKQLLNSENFNELYDFNIEYFEYYKAIK